MAADFPDISRLRLPCAAHITSTVQGKCFGVVDSDIAGAISCSLAARPGGSSRLLRQQIVTVLVASCRPRDAHRPPSSDNRMKHRDNILDLALSDHIHGNVKRKARLQLLLTGDITQDYIDWFVPGVASPDVEKWAKELAYELYPTMIPVFPRQRWINALGPVSEYMLLHVHNVLPRAGRLWLLALEGKTLPRVIVAHHGRRPALLDTWQVSDDDDEE